MWITLIIIYLWAGLTCHRLTIKFDSGCKTTGWFFAHVLFWPLMLIAEALSDL